MCVQPRLWVWILLYYVFGVVAVVCPAFFSTEMPGKTSAQMDELFGDPPVSYALEHTLAAEIAISKAAAIEHNGVEEFWKCARVEGMKYEEICYVPYPSSPK
jgi:hypothetical protein